MKRFVRSFALVVLLLPLLGVGILRTAAAGARVVNYSQQDIIPIHAELHFSTLIVLPDDEEILDFTTGDKDFWIINGAHNLCYVHPAAAGIRSNLNLVTASGHVYSFLLTEISNEPGAEPDLKVFVRRGGDSQDRNPLRGYVRAADAQAYKSQLDELRSESASQIRMARAEAAREIASFRSSYATRLRFDYRLNPKARREPFRVTAIYHDDAFTYIQCAAREKPALYEIKDDKPSLVNFQLEQGVYIAPTIIDSGYLAIGKKKLKFVRRASGN